MKNKKVSLLIAALAIISSIFMPFANAYATLDKTGEERLKQFLYVYAITECLDYASDSHFNESLTYGKSISDIFKYDPLQSSGGVLTNDWMGSVSCKDALSQLYGSNIQESAIKSGGILEGVYAAAMSSEFDFSCNYAIINSEATDFIKDGSGNVKIYTWPQGYVYNEQGEYDDKRSTTPIKMRHNESGYLNQHSGGPSDVNPEIDSAISNAWNSDISKICNSIRYVPVYYGGLAYDGVTKYYNEIESTDDDNPLNEGFDLYDGKNDYDAVFVNSDRNAGHYYTHTDTQLAGSTGIEYQSGGAAQLKQNILKRYLGGKSVEEFFNGDSDLQYTLYGRYLFNGDGKFGAGCGGISVATDDPNIDKLNDATWNTSLSYIKTTKAYESGSSNKKEYRTKLGGSSDYNAAGSVKEVYMTPWSRSSMKCDSLVTSFNSITGPTPASKTAVEGYIGVIEAPESGIIDTPDVPDPGELPEAEPSCYDNAGSLGWILCPIIEQVSDAIQSIYEDYIVPFLKLEPQLFEQSSGTFEAWKQFRDIANVLFIILFLFVIFSQLTGIGIDNYGIKKILPKLIVGAILINMSYIICQLCVDVANIIGLGIGGLFENIAPYDPSSISVSGGTIPEGLTSATVILVALVAAVTVGTLLAIGPSVLIPVFMALLSVVIAILFCFALLAVRKAFAVILVAISPLAFACYMLPNTKKLFDKWFNTFKGVLMAFPICSAMIYGGQMVARIIIAATGGSSIELPIALSAAAISIVPIFMIPKAIQGSMAAVAGGLIAMQGRLTGRARSGLNRSNWAEDRRRASTEMHNRRAAGVNMFGNESWRSKHLRDSDSTIGKLRRGKIVKHIPGVGISTQKDQRLAAARQRYLNDQRERDTVNTLTGQSGFEDAKVAQDAAIIEANIGNSSEINDINGLQDSLETAIRTDDKAKIIAYQNVLSGKGDKGREAVRNAMSNVQAQTGTMDEKQKAAVESASQTYGSNLINGKYAGDYKANSRSTYEYAMDASTGNGSIEAGAMNSYSGVKLDKLSTKRMAELDDGELDRMTQAMGANVSYNSDGTYNISYDLANATMSQSEAESYANMAQATLDDKNVSLSDERRRQLTAIVDAYTSPAYQNTNVTSKIKPMRKNTPSNTSGGTGTPPGGTGHADPRSASNHPAPPAPGGPGPAPGPAPGGPGGGRRP